MLVEHSFVTTQEWKDVIARLVEPMKRLDFRWEHTCASCGYDVRGSLLEGRTVCSECGKAAPLVFSRGRKSPARAKGVNDCPQRLQLEFDRGRIMAAASLTPRGKGTPMHGHAITELVRSVERFLTEEKPFDEAFANWRRTSAAYDREVQRKRTRGRLIAYFIVLGIIALLVLIAVLAAMSNGRGRRSMLIQPPAICFSASSNVSSSASVLKTPGLMRTAPAG